MARTHPLAHVLPALIACGTMAALGAGAAGQPASGALSSSRLRLSESAAPARAKMTASRIEKYAKALGLDEVQTSAAKDLYEAYQRDTAAASQKMRDAMQGAQEDMVAGDHAAFEKGMQKTMGEHAAASAKLTETFLSDLRSLLKPEQADRWPGFERLRRREKYLNLMMGMGGMGVGGSSVDLIPIVEKHAGGVPAEAKARVAEVMGMYEVDVDRPLQERERNFEDERKTMGVVQNFDGESFKKKQERDRKVDLAIREVNLKYVRLVQGVLPEEAAKAFAENYQVRAFRNIYKESNVSKRLTQAQKIPGLSADQGARLRAAQEAYKAEVRRANDAWAAAQQRAETEGRAAGDGFLFMGPGMTGDDKADPELSAARSARRAIDDAAREKMESILTPEQLASMPKPQQGMLAGQTVHVFGDGSGDDMVFVADIEADGDMPPGDGGVMIIRSVEIEETGPRGGGGGGGQTTPAKKAD